VAFHAKGLQSNSPPYNTPLVFRDVHLNEGGSYNSATGYFTVSVPGLYYFIGTTGPNSANSAVSFYLYVDNTLIDRGHATNPTDLDMSSVHGVVHLQAGQRVWVSNAGGSYNGAFSAFTGFLLSPDF
jgi:hypothetical protein